jgi:hypothetical protein
MQGLYPEDAIRLGLYKQWMEQLEHAVHSFQLVFTGKLVGHSYIHIALIPAESPEGQAGWRLPVYIGMDLVEN